MNNDKTKPVIIIGGGPGGLMAAETLAKAGIPVTIYERKPTLGRKFLMAGRGGLNLTHSEDIKTFMTRYGAAAEKLRPAIENFPPSALREWCEGLGQPTFVGTSGRVFPKSLKASPLLRAWQIRLSELGVTFVFQRQWLGWNSAGELVFTNTEGKTETAAPAATILALGGASWPRLGSDGGWVKILQQQKIPVTPLRPANCGFAVTWSEIFRSRCAGQPLKPVMLSFAGKNIQGEMMLTEKGIEGGAVYALSAALRDAIEKNGSATLTLDLRPGVSSAELIQRLSAPRGTLSFSNFLRKKGGLSPVAVALTREIGGKEVQTLSPAALTALIKALPLRLEAPFPLDRAISTAGGIGLDALDDHFMLKNKPGVFTVGEMLNWEAPTGGYLLQATFSTAVYAAEGVMKRVGR
ncbi:MAG: TIGR03862 family flavoprotein [Alphaproteobacteria bacterium]|nr:TIGR03862 family flavoprotein [Alphaproteobacteria bacterium]